MRVFISLFLTIFIYSFILFFFIYFLFFREKQQIDTKQVFIHKAIIVKSKSKIIKKSVLKKQTIKKLEKKKVIEKKVVKKIVQKEDKSIDSFAKGGKKIKFDDIFETVSDQIKTTKIENKKRDHLTKKVGDSIKNDDTAFQLVNKAREKLEVVAQISVNSGKQKDGDYISTQFGKIWNSFYTKIDDYISLYVTISDGKLNLSVVSTNLDTISLNQFLMKLKQIDVSKIKSFRGIVKFNLKLKEKDKK